jgi:esterase
MLEQIHYQVTGDPQSNKKLVFLHGLMGYAANWRGIARPFAKEFHILCYDRVYLVGHSMGGRIAAHFAFRYPQRVERLVIEDIGPDANPQAIVRIEELIDGIPAPFAHKDAAKEYFFKDFYQQYAHRRNLQPLSQFLYSNFAENDQGQFTWKFNIEVMRQCVKKGRERERFSEFAALTMPTLLMRGEHSEELSTEVFQRVLKENSRIRGVEVEGAGHWVHFDQANLFIGLLQDFWRE